MNVFSNSDIVPESRQPSIIEEPAYGIIGYHVQEVFWTDGSDGHEKKESELLGEFQDKASAQACYNKNRTGIRRIRIEAVHQYPDGHIEYARIRGAK